MYHYTHDLYETFKETKFMAACLVCRLMYRNAAREGKCMLIIIAVISVCMGGKPDVCFQRTALCVMSANNKFYRTNPKVCIGVPCVSINIPLLDWITTKTNIASSIPILQMVTILAIFIDVQLSVDRNTQNVYSHYKLALNSTEAALFCEFQGGQLFGEYNQSIYDQM